MQTLKNGAFQLPAQAKPEGEISTTPGLFEVKVKVGEMLLFVPFCALALNTKVLPNCMETLVEGFRVILAGKGFEPAGLCPPHAGRSENKKMVMAMNAYRTQRNLPMHPLVA